MANWASIEEIYTFRKVTYYTVSPDLAPKFRFAQQVSKAIDPKIRNQELQVVGKRLVGDLEIFI